MPANSKEHSFIYALPSGSNYPLLFGYKTKAAMESGTGKCVTVSKGFMKVMAGLVNPVFSVYMNDTLWYTSDNVPTSIVDIIDLFAPQSITVKLQADIMDGDNSSTTRNDTLEMTLFTYNYTMEPLLRIEVEKNPIPPGQTARVSVVPDMGPLWTWSVPTKEGVSVALSPKAANNIRNAQVLPTLTGETPTGSIVVQAENTEKGITVTSSEIPVECPCNECTFGDETSRLSSINAKFNLGSGKNGNSAGNLRLKSDTADPANATPAALVLAASASSTRAIYANGALRQVIAPQTLVDINVQDEYAYTMDFYPRTDLSLDSMSNGVYEIEAGASPTASWTIENLDRDANCLRLGITNSIANTSDGTGTLE